MNWCCAHSQAPVRPGRAEQHSDQATAQAFADAVSHALIADVGFGTLAQVVIIRRAPPKDDVDRGRRSCSARRRLERRNCAALSVTGDRSVTGTTLSRQRALMAVVFWIAPPFEDDPDQ